MEVLLRLPSAENREEAGTVCVGGWGGTRATNVLIAISDCDCKWGCNLWPRTVSVSDLMPGSDE